MKKKALDFDPDEIERILGNAIQSCVKRGKVTQKDLPKKRK